MNLVELSDDIPLVFIGMYYYSERYLEKIVVFAEYKAFFFFFNREAVNLDWNNEKNTQKLDIRARQLGY